MLQRNRIPKRTLPRGWGVPGWGFIHTVIDIAILDLLEDFRPDGCVYFFVFLDEFWLELYDLPESATGV